MADQHTPRPDPGELDEATLEFARSTFHYARSGAAAELEGLLGQGLPPNLRNERGDSLLMLACYHGHLEAARALLAHGADPEIANDAGQTPLAAAAFKGDIPIATLLLDHGAQADNGGPAGKTPLMIAAMFNRIDMARLLLARGASPFATDSAGVSIVDAARRMGAADTFTYLFEATSGM